MKPSHFYHEDQPNYEEGLSKLSDFKFNDIVYDHVNRYYGVVIKKTVKGLECNSFGKDLLINVSNATKVPKLTVDDIKFGDLVRNLKTGDLYYVTKILTNSVEVGPLNPNVKVSPTYLRVVERRDDVSYFEPGNRIIILKGLKKGKVVNLGKAVVFVEVENCNHPEPYLPNQIIIDAKYYADQLES